MITLAVVGRNEEDTLGTALALARKAAERCDEVLYVDSGSTDRSVDVARAMGVDVVLAPEGKGNAVAVALREARGDHVCLLDADTFNPDAVLAERLAACAREGHTLMAVGQFDESGKGGVLSNTVGIYEPLVRGLFPEAAGLYGPIPLSGFRVVDRRSDWWGRLPADFGVEAHLNVRAAHHDRERVDVIPIGAYRGRFLYKPFMGREIGKAVLDVAVMCERLGPAARPAWDAWVETVVQHVATYRGEPEGRERFREQLLQLAARELPPTRNLF